MVGSEYMIVTRILCPFGHRIFIYRGKNEHKSEKTRIIENRRGQKRICNSMGVAYFIFSAIICIVI